MKLVNVPGRNWLFDLPKKAVVVIEGMRDNKGRYLLGEAHEGRLFTTSLGKVGAAT